MRYRELMEGAEDLGFTTPAFHGTHASFDRFEPSRTADIGMHFGTVDQANDIVSPSRLRPDGANVMPVVLRLKNPLRVHDQFSTLRKRFIARAKQWTLDTPGFHATPEERAEIYRAAKAADAARRKAGGDYSMYLTRSPGDSARDDFHREAKAFWRAIEQSCLRQGYDGLVYRNRVEGKRGQDSYVVFDPKNVRSRFAAFDPAKSDSDHLMDSRRKHPSRETIGAERETSLLSESVAPPVTYDQVVTPEWITTVLTRGFEVGVPHAHASGSASGGHDPDSVSRMLEDLQSNGFIPKEVDLDSARAVFPFVAKWMKLRFDYVIRHIEADAVGGRYRIYRALRLSREAAHRLASGDGSLGSFWSFGPSGAEPYWGNEDHDDVLIEAMVAGDRIDWITTIRRNMNYVHGENEQEVFLRPGTPVQLLSITLVDETLPVANPRRTA